MSKNVKLLWQIYPPYMFVVLISLLTFTWYGTTVIRRLYLEKTASDLKARCQLLSEVLFDIDMQKEENRADSTAKELGKQIHTRITIILPSGKVMGDSDEEPDRMDNHSDRPEVKKALQGETGMSTRYSATLKREMMYVAIQSRAKPLYIIRTAVPLNRLTETLNGINHKIFWFGFILILFAALTNYVLSQRIQKPIHSMVSGFKIFGKGNLSHRVVISSSKEFDILANSMNNMADELQERILTITRQRNELEAVLSGMKESVLVVNKDEKIIRFNDAAKTEFELSPNSVYGLNIQETIRHHTLQKFIQKTLQSMEPQEEEIVLHETSDRIMQAFGTLLKDANEEIIGALVVLNDVTRLKILENIRKDFVANVSHELKTPVTSIKGYVETLKEGAIDDAQNAHRFLDIISKHADRLNSIIEDLLNLSRIEQESGTQQVALEDGNIHDVLEEAKTLCLSKASEKNIEIKIDAPSTLQGKINPPLLEQTMINLIDNAIKYSPVHNQVLISAYEESGTIFIKVQDWGCGIAQKHLSRLFERFYRVDKARSRQLGGTGLGLAIVKHIVQAHNGTVHVASALNEGTTFTIRLPKG